MWGAVEFTCRHWRRVRAVERDQILKSRSVVCDFCGATTTPTGRVRKSGKVYADMNTLQAKRQAKGRTRTEQHRDPSHLRGIETRILGLLDADVPAQQLHRHVNRSAQNVDAILRNLEERKFLSLMWMDGQPVWKVAPDGPWRRSAASIRRNGVRS